MKKIIIMLSLLALPCLQLLAQDNPAKPGKTAAKPAVKNDAAPLDVEGVDKYTESGKTEELKSDFRILIISGNGNKLTVKGTVEKIIISGKDNDVTLPSVNQIVITGSDNFVSWESSKNASGKPVVQDKGGYNNVGKKSGNALDKTEN